MRSWISSLLSEHHKNHGSQITLSGIRCYKVSPLFTDLANERAFKFSTVFFSIDHVPQREDLCTIRAWKSFGIRYVYRGPFLQQSPLFSLTGSFCQSRCVGIPLALQQLIYAGCEKEILYLYRKVAANIPAQSRLSFLLPTYPSSNLMVTILNALRFCILRMWWLPCHPSSTYNLILLLAGSARCLQPCCVISSSIVNCFPKAVSVHYGLRTDFLQNQVGDGQLTS